MHNILLSWMRKRRTRRRRFAPPFNTLTAWAGITTAATLLFLPAGLRELGSSRAAEQKRETAKSQHSNFTAKPVSLKPQASRSPVETQTAAAEPPVSNDDKFRTLLAGEWEQQYYGKRRLTVREDGTATMVVEPDGIWVHLFGEKIEVEIEWTLDNGRVNLKITGGTPSDKIELASKMWGDCWTQPILELTENRLLLLGEDGVTKYDWTRVSNSRG